jgi:uncharacterized protein YvpB
MKLSILRVKVLIVLTIGMISGLCNSTFAHSLKGDPTAIDRLIELEKESDFEKGIFTSTAFADVNGVSGVLISSQKLDDNVTTGCYESSSIDVGFNFREILPSWNFELPDNTGYAIQISTAKDDGKWSKWLYIGGQSYGDKLPFNKTRRGNEGRVDTDHWVGENAASQIKYRVWLFSHDGKHTPTLKRFFIHARGYSRDNSDFSETIKPDEISNVIPDKVNVEVPWRSQLILSRPLRGRTCCPTSVAMVLEYRGYDFITTQVAQMVYDEDSRIFGNWPRAAQLLSEYGMRAYVRQYRNLDEARQTLSKAQPIITSIKFEEGELPEAPIRRTNGHLIVITGYEGDDWFIVNDPATLDPNKGRQMKYSAAGIQKAWIDNGGPAIIGENEK